MNVRAHVPRRPQVSDEAIATAGTVAVMLLVQLLCLRYVAALDLVEATGAEQTRGSSSAPLWLFGVFVVESLVIVVGYRLYKRLGERWQRAVKIVLVGLAYLAIAQLFYLVGGWWGVGFYTLAIGVTVLGQRFGVQWILHNLGAVAMAVVGALLVGTIIGPWPLVGLLVLFIVWDHVAVNESGIMATIVEFAAATGLPAFLVFSRSARLDLDAVTDALQDDGEMPDAATGIIGTGDFVFPAALTVSVSTAVLEAGGDLSSVVVIGPLLGGLAAAGMLWTLKGEGAAPALPVLNGGAIVGFLLAVAANGGVVS